MSVFGESGESVGREVGGSKAGVGGSPGKADPEPRENRLASPASPSPDPTSVRWWLCRDSPACPLQPCGLALASALEPQTQDAHRGCLLRYPDPALPLAPLEILCFWNSFQGWAPVLHVAQRVANFLIAKVELILGKKSCSNQNHT